MTAEQLLSHALKEKAGLNNPTIEKIIRQIILKRPVRSICEDGKQKLWQEKEFERAKG